MSLATSSLQCLTVRSCPCRLTRSLRSSGSPLAMGMFAPFTRSGKTLTPRRNASATSPRSVSWGSSKRRLPLGSLAFSHPRPMTTSSAVTKRFVKHRSPRQSRINLPNIHEDREVLAQIIAEPVSPKVAVLVSIADEDVGHARILLRCGRNSAGRRFPQLTIKEICFFAPPWWSRTGQSLSSARSRIGIRPA